jgi:nickel/cobalt exporter
MRKLRTLLGFWGLAAILHAHPMGNFSVNHYARIEVTPEGAKILFVLDLAEIPTFELMQKWGAAKDTPAAQMQGKAAGEAREWVRQLRISVDGKRVTPVFEGAELTLADGAGGLPVAHVRVHLRAARGAKLEYEDGTYPDRTAGWKEIVVAAGRGAAIEKASQGEHDRSQELTAYPQDATVAPPQDLKAEVSWSGGVVSRVVRAKDTENETAVSTKPAEQPATKTAGTVAEPNAMGTVKRGDFLSRTLQGKEIGWGLGLICIAVAFWFGALHALEPGHGKTMVAAYLVGSRGTPKHAILLGGMVTFTHTVTVFILGLITLFLSRYVQADLLSKILGVVSGLTIVWIGGMLLYRRVKALGGAVHGHRHHHDDHGHAHDHEHAREHVHAAHAHDHGHAHDHDHHHDHDGHTHSHGGLTHTHDGHTHSHVPEGEISLRSLMVLGASGGLVPCPSALVLLLSAISIGRTGFGLLLLVSFSLGLALVLMATGLVVLYAKNLFPERKDGGTNPFFRVMPVISAAVILTIGIVLTGNAVGVIPVIRFFG